MSKVNYEEMTNKELQALIDDFELTLEAKIQVNQLRQNLLQL